MSPNAENDDRLKALTDKLEAGVKDVFESESYRTYLKAMAKFHSYSFGNVMLILIQRPDASLVAGFNKWKKDFGRSVKKGERGIQIIAPVNRRKLVQQERLDPASGKPVLGPDGKPEKEPVFVQYQSFRVTHVFDVSQTEGRELPTLGVGELSEEVTDFDALFSVVEGLSTVSVEYRPAQASKGCYNRLEQKIYINEGMSQAQTIKTLIHETAHALLHSAPDAENKDRRTKEVEAESIAYVVCQHFGIDTSDYSFTYVSSWSSGKELKELKASLDCISKTAAGMINGIEKACPEMSRGAEVKRKEECVSR